MLVCQMRLLMHLFHHMREVGHCGTGTADCACVAPASAPLPWCVAPYWKMTCKHAVQVRIMCDGLIQTLGRVTYGGKVDHPFTAHPKIDPKTGEGMRA